jgi:hypothetical protein
MDRTALPPLIHTCPLLLIKQRDQHCFPWFTLLTQTDQHCFPWFTLLTQTDQHYFPWFTLLTQTDQHCFPWFTLLTQTDQHCFPWFTLLTQTDQHCFPRLDPWCGQPLWQLPPVGHTEHAPSASQWGKREKSIPHLPLWFCSKITRKL